MRNGCKSYRKYSNLFTETVEFWYSDSQLLMMGNRHVFVRTLWGQDPRRLGSEPSTGTPTSPNREEGRHGGAAMREKIQINPKQVLEDLRSGLDDQGFMLKYELTYRQLQNLFRKMIKGGYISASELASRLCVTKSQIMKALSLAGKNPFEDDHELITPDKIN
jgi:hypothetical protein